MSIELTQEHVFLDNDVETPISLFLGQVGEAPGILLESAEVDGRWGRHSVIVKDFLLVLACSAGRLRLSIADERLEPLARHAGQPFVDGVRAVMRDIRILVQAADGGKLPDLPPITRALYGYFGYGMAGLFEPKLAGTLPPAEAEACLVLPGTTFLFDHVFNKVSRLSLLPAGTEPRHGAADTSRREAKAGPAQPGLSREAYQAMVREVQGLIRAGEIIQAVTSLPFTAEFSGEPFTIYRRLRRINPSPYLFFMRLPEVTLMGSSPEVMVGCDKNKLRLSPIAGTKPRGETAGEDNLFEEELISDPKEQAEHVMLVDLGRNDLGRVAAPGSVALERYMEVERFSHVMHLTSYISAELQPGLDALDVLAAAFPAGTVSGAPKIRAMEIIAKMEKRPRGPYAGCIGWLGLDKDSVNLDTGITIRSLWVRDGRIHWQAGGGIVLDSRPENEWKECNNKAAAVLAAIKGEQADVSAYR